MRPLPDVPGAGAVASQTGGSRGELEQSVGVIGHNHFDRSFEKLLAHLLELFLVGLVPTGSTARDRRRARGLRWTPTCARRRSSALGARRLRGPFDLVLTVRRPQAAHEAREYREARERAVRHPAGNVIKRTSEAGSFDRPHPAVPDEPGSRFTRISGWQAASLLAVVPESRDPKQEEYRIATTTASEIRINDRIRAREVRLVDPDGLQLGIKPLPEALAIARQFDLDLVEVAPLANPPVCRIMDYGKFKFDEAQKARESRRKTSNTGIKEMKYRPKIGPGDFDTKTRRVMKFLNEGHKVKVTIMFRGRELGHPELGRRILDRLAEELDGTARIETEARLDGRNMVMVLAPDKSAKQSQAARSKKATVPEQAAQNGHSDEPTQQAQVAIDPGEATDAEGAQGTES